MSNLRIRHQSDILWLILDRPPLNILSIEMLDQLTKAMRDAIKNPPKLIVLSGAGEQAFCAGVDTPDDTEEERAQLLHVATTLCAAFRALYARHIMTVALVKGLAFGAGCELAAMCDVVIAREDARFRLPAINARVFHDAIAIYLPNTIGHENTTRLMQSGETQEAHQAMSIGLVQQVLPAQNFLNDTEELLAMLATITT